MSTRVLVLPGGMPASLRFIDGCKRLGIKCVGASSLPGDQAAQAYAAWAYIPSITSDAFESALQQVIGEHKIERIFVPHLVVWQFLDRHLDRIAPGVVLIGPSPIDVEMMPYRSADRWARDEVPLALTSEPLRDAPTRRQRQAYWHHVERVPGMCDTAKLAAMLSIFNSAPAGDIVEIGSWWGRSAVAFALLNQNADLGTLLCVDPWDDEAIVQHDSPAILNETSHSANTDEAFAVFCCNLLPYSSGRTNYLRMPSVEAAKRYADGNVTSPEFGTTFLQCSISILHIDGNHDYKAVHADIDSWSPYLRSGSWVIFDDYVWSFGDGPRLVADAYLRQHQAQIGCAFACGSALFVQLA